MGVSVLVCGGWGLGAGCESVQANIFTSVYVDVEVVCEQISD
jgi:hypothetical protein